MRDGRLPAQLFQPQPCWPPETGPPPLTEGEGRGVSSNAPSKTDDAGQFLAHPPPHPITPSSRGMERRGRRPLWRRGERRSPPTLPHLHCRCCCWKPPHSLLMDQRPRDGVMVRPGLLPAGSRRNDRSTGGQLPLVDNSLGCEFWGVPTHCPTVLTAGRRSTVFSQEALLPPQQWHKNSPARIAGQGPKMRPPLGRIFGPNRLRSIWLFHSRGLGGPRSGRGGSECGGGWPPRSPPRAPRCARPALRPHDDREWDHS